MNNYACFLHPDIQSKDFAESLNCPKCGRPFRFPVDSAPQDIDGLKIIRSIDRGFYSAAYIAEIGPFKREQVLKVVPAELYVQNKKDFYKECEEHARVAKGSEHIVDISDRKLNVKVKFGDVEILCHYAVMDYVQGATLREYLEGDSFESITVAQIAMDMFSILAELANKNTFHNDLHAGNLVIQKLDRRDQRTGVEDPFTRLIVIDMNSMSDESKSDPETKRLGDLRWAINHLRSLSQKLMRTPAERSDLEYRLAATLDEKVALFLPDNLMHRPPTFETCIDDIRQAIRQQLSPWSEELRLRRFNDNYNAQTLSPWFVPYILVDPKENWIGKISTHGPQVITGMRGCGKTMLLRALQFHARITVAPDQAENPKKEAIEKVTKDKYVGLYVSALRLLDSLDEKMASEEPFARLFVGYAIEALRAIRHLRDVDEKQVLSNGFKEIATTVASFVKGASSIAEVQSEYHLERSLHELMIQLTRSDTQLGLPANPIHAFTGLAEAIRKCSPIWANAQVFYLLDDVSTRYLKGDRIKQLISSLIFSSDLCAFKMTTEAQTLQIILRSPGQIEMARPGRDYDVFDLGAEVNDLTRMKAGVDFIDKVLQQRTRYFRRGFASGISPRGMLGDVSMEAIAIKIGETAVTSRERKKIYHGITALARVCVGDIGDIINIYELILQERKNGSVPVDPQVQSECFQEFCSRRLFNLNNKDGWLKDHAISFAEASHELLMQSYKTYAQNGNKGRIRQYLKVYVRVTAGNMNEQFEQLRRLVDANVFVLDGGTYRTKTKDSDPIQQFKITFRKLFGLSNFIGLAERDRFELSGEDLEKWLKDPSKSKDVLLRNLVEDDSTEGQEEEDEQSAPEKPAEEAPTPSAQVSLQLDFGSDSSQNREEPEIRGLAVAKLLAEKVPHARATSFDEVKSAGIDCLVLGLGFEERTLQSAKRILEQVVPKRVVCIAYDEEGKSSEILEALKKHPGAEVQKVSYKDALRAGLNLPAGRTAVDITGLAKPVIFATVQNLLQRDGKLAIVHTGAREYYPSDGEIEKILQAEKDKDRYTLLESMKKVFTGEKDPYKLIPLLKVDADNSRRRVLFAFSNAKHQRLLSLLDLRDYEAITIGVRDGSTARGKLAHIAANHISGIYPGVRIEQMQSYDLNNVIAWLGKGYYEWYVDNGFNYELGLTGSKIQAVACAALSSVVKVSQCWYVSPTEFDQQRFTHGVTDTRLWALEVPAT